MHLDIHISALCSAALLCYLLFIHFFPCHYYYLVIGVPQLAIMVIFVGLTEFCNKILLEQFEAFARNSSNRMLVILETGFGGSM